MDYDDHPSFHGAQEKHPRRAPLKHLAHKRTLPGLSRLETTVRLFSPAERLLLYLLGTILVVSTVGMLALLNDTALTSQPTRGGTLTEGVLGTPRFVNPLLSATDTDQDAAALVFSGLVSIDAEGNFVPNLAESYEISEDGKVYTFVLRDDITFHDGTPVTAADVVFTAQTAQDPAIKSPRRADWEGVSAAQLDEHTVQFTLPRPYAPFLENTTLGILPKHLWQSVSPEEFPFHSLNTQPIGSGPFKLTETKRDNTGTPIAYTFEPFNNYALGTPYLNRIVMQFFSNEDALVEALEHGDIDSAAGLTPARMQELTLSNSTVHTATLPRVFALFFNQNQAPILARAAVRDALIRATDQQSIIDTVLFGYAEPLVGPIPPGILAEEDSLAPPTTGTPAQVEEILTDDGWEFSDEAGTWVRDEATLSLTITTVNTPELIATAEAVASMWRNSGIEVEVRVFSPSELTANIIRPRSYEILLFGEIVGRSLDLFAFWHSSQRNDPGLNLALYTNSEADDLLSQARTDSDREEREEHYRAFADLVREDQPAAFLYAPHFIYVTPERLSGIELGILTTPSERFDNVHEWYLDSEKIWYIFQN